MVTNQRQMLSVSMQPNRKGKEAEQVLMLALRLLLALGALAIWWAFFTQSETRFLLLGAGLIVGTVTLFGSGFGMGDQRRNALVMSFALLLLTLSEFSFHGLFGSHKLYLWTMSAIAVLAYQRQILVAVFSSQMILMMGAFAFLVGTKGFSLSLWVEETAMLFLGSTLLTVLILHFLRQIDQETFEKRLAEQQNTELMNQLMEFQRTETLGQLTGGVAHDFNNMLTAIDGLAEISREQTESAAIKEHLDEILRTSGRAGQLTSQLLAYIRRETTAKEMVNLVDLIERDCRMLQPLLRDVCELKSQVSESQLHVYANAIQIEQVVVNLVINAKDASQPGGLIEIMLETVDELDGVLPELGATNGAAAGFVKLTVRDYGKGLSQAVKANLFEPFYTTKERGHGTGLGLATVKNIVDQHSGFVEAVARSDGADFVVYLPVSSA